MHVHLLLLKVECGKSHLLGASQRHLLCLLLLRQHRQPLLRLCTSCRQCRRA